MKATLMYGLAEAMRVPFADGTLVVLPGRNDDELMPSILALTDVMGTGHHAAISAIEHLHGGGSRQTALDPPVAIAYAEQHANFVAARRREVQLKRRSRPKKEALIRGDLTELKRLSRTSKVGALWPGKERGIRPATGVRSSRFELDFSYIFHFFTGRSLLRLT
jgi:predicted GIY-YIG superfamily endonuclease